MMMKKAARKKESVLVQKKEKNDALRIDKEEIIKAKDIPPEAKFKGYQRYVVQGLEIKTVNTRYLLERWQLPDGRYKVFKLPAHLQGHHFDLVLHSYVLHQYHHQEVTQPLLLAQLREWGVDISSGQLNRILTKGKDSFHEEKAGLLKAGLSASSYIQVDDTGARHKGKMDIAPILGMMFRMV
jgi:hypothetical protein